MPFAPWMLAFPLTYLAHIAEEGLAPVPFYRWIRRAPVVRRLDLRMTARGFYAANAGFMALMLAALALSGSPGLGFLVPGLGVVVAANGIGHLAASIMTRSYSPGVVTGMALWAPLGGFAIASGYAQLPHQAFYAGLIAGLLAHGGVFAVAIALGRAGRTQGEVRSARLDEATPR